MTQPEDLRLADHLLCRQHAELERKSDAIQKLWKERDALRDELELQKAPVAEAQAMTAKVCAENEALRAKEATPQQAAPDQSAINDAIDKLHMLMMPVPAEEVTALEVCKVVSERALEIINLLQQAAPQQAAPVGPSDASDILSKVCDLFRIGKAAREESTILANVKNAIRQAGLLHALERDLFPQPELPEDDDPYATVDDELPAPSSWGAKDEADYVSQFRAALLARGFAAPQQPGLVPLADVLARVDACAGPGSAVRLALEREFASAAAELEQLKQYARQMANPTHADAVAFLQRAGIMDEHGEIKEEHRA